jgi:hypothetical protein
MRFLTLFLLFAAFVAFGQQDKPTLLTPQKRIALVIGNSDYLYAPRLASPTVDAQAMAKALQEVGFEVLTLTDASLQEMEVYLDSFTIRVERDSFPVALCYYTGHGLQVNGENYLIPVDAEIRRESDVKHQCMNAQWLIDRMEEARALTKIVLLDACRNNPFHKSWSKSVTSNGLAFMQAPAGTFIGFSTAPGTVAYDGSGQNSPYTKGILENLKTPNLEINQVFNRVCKSTQQWASNQGFSQVPFTSSSLSGDFYFLLEEGSPQLALLQQESGSKGTNETTVAPASQSKKRGRDSDFDGVSDDADECPTEYGTLRGCPDSDKDGIADHKDKCPDEPGTEANKGCPVRDSDGDGVADAVDKCPDKQGTKDWQGCPDSDGDGVPDHRDECPGILGVAAKKGCPEDIETIADALVGTFVKIKGGEFEMGNENGDSIEKPVHRVFLSDFYIGQAEVTQAQWKAVMGSDPSRFNNCDHCPVEQISWNEIQSFLQKLNSSSGVNYRLPTEAEWEYAARGGAHSKGYIYAGSNNIDEVAWYNGNAGNQTHPVKGKAPNELYLYDMTGNVFEWCSDWYGSYPDGSQTNPSGATHGYGRVFRGGSLFFPPKFCHNTLRGYDRPTGRSPDLGFRLARSVSF